MSFFLIFVGIFILIVILIFYYLNNKLEKFADYTPEQIKSLSNIEITKIRNNYTRLKSLYASGLQPTNMNVLQMKEIIRQSFINIENLLVNTNDKYLLSLIYYGNNKNNINYDNYDETNYYNTNYVIKYLDQINDIEFNKLIDKINVIIVNATTDNNYKSNIIVSQITTDFVNLNNLYKNVYINKIYVNNNNLYNEKNNEINDLTLKIFTQLLSITNYDNIYNSGIILILNTTLKRAYETDNMYEINNNINSFNQKLALIKTQYVPVVTGNSSNVTTSNVVTTANSSNDVTTNTPIGVFNNDIANSSYTPTQTNQLTIENIKDDFDNITNAFNLINNSYKNNIQNKEVSILNLNNIIYMSIDNISNYYKNNNDYKDRIISVKNAFIRPILEMELRENYALNDQNKINATKNKFNNNINEIISIIININTKTTDNNIETCLNNIINAGLANQYPINVNNISSCDKSFFNTSNIIVNKPV